MKLYRILRNVSAVAVGSVMMLTAQQAVAKSYPENDVTMIVQSSAGGGSDILARTIANVIQKNNLIPTRLLVENRPGGGGAIAYNYIAQRKGNPYYVGTLATSFFTTPLLGLSPTNYTDFTLIGAVAADPFILVVNGSSAIKSLDDIKAMKSIRVGNTGPVTDAAMLGAQLAKHLNVGLRAVPFNGAGEVTTALLGNHIDMQFGNVTQVMSQIASGRMLPIAVTSSERLDAYPDVPTFRELGVDIELELYRGMMMPAGVPEEVVAYWENVLRQVAESEDWKEDYIKKNNAFPLYLTSQELTDRVPSIVKQYEEFIESIKK